MNLHPDEPYIIFRAADIAAPNMVITWARAVIQNPKATRQNFDKACQGLVIAQRMMDWQMNNPDKVKLPD